MSTFLLPDETRLSQVHLRVGDAERALSFYGDLVGLSVNSTEGPTTGLGPHGSDAPLLLLTEDRSAPPRVERSTGLYHVAFRYPSRVALAVALQRLIAKDYPISGAADHRVSEAIYLTDPAGNGVELYWDRPSTQWVWRNGQVAMSTDALDLDGLLAEKRSENPGPAVIAPDLGHIHLHVADLQKAEQFYQNYLGLAVTQRSYPGALFLAAGGYHHHLAANTWAGNRPAKPGSVGLISYRFEVPLREILYCLENRAPLLGYETHRTDDILQIRDPNDNWLEVQFREKP